MKHFKDVNLLNISKISHPAAWIVAGKLSRYHKIICDGKDTFALAIIFSSKCLSKTAFLLRLFRKGNSWNKYEELHLFQFKWNRDLLIGEQKSKARPNLFQLFSLFLLSQLFHSQRWNRQNRRNTLPALPISKNCHAPFNISLFHLFLFLKITKRNAV